MWPRCPPAASAAGTREHCPCGTVSAKKPKRFHASRRTRPHCLRRTDYPRPSKHSRRYLDAGHWGPRPARACPAMRTVPPAPGRYAPAHDVRLAATAAAPPARRACLLLHSGFVCRVPAASKFKVHAKGLYSKSRLQSTADPL